MKQLNPHSLYQFNYTMNATISDGSALLGTSRDNTYEFDLSALNRSITNALNKLDGTLPLEKVMMGLTGSDREEFTEFLTELLNANIIADTKDLKLEVNPRYDRQINYFYNATGTLPNAVKVQEKIARSRIAIIGLGGVGSFVLYNLASMGVKYIRAYDFDTVELSNLSRQMLYSHNDLGRKR